jgi:hypothetical protein
MMLALFVIGSAAGMVLLAARLREALDELARSEEDRDALRRERYAEACGTALAVAFVLAVLGAWYAMPRPAGAGQAGAEAGGAEQEAGRE